MKNKKIIIIVSIILIIGIATLGYYIYKEQEKNETEQEITYKDTDAYINLNCRKEHITDNGDNTIFSQGESIICYILLFNLKNDKETIRWEEITATYELDDELEYRLDDKEENQNTNKNKTATITLKYDNKNDYNEEILGVHELNLKLKDIVSKEKITIKIKDVKIKTKDGNYYKVKDYVYETEIKKDNNYTFDLDEETNIYTFYKYENGYQKINEYTCESDNCYHTIQQCFGLYDLENGKIAITDGNKIVFYDFNKGKYGEYGQTIYTLHDENNEPKYYYVSDLKTNKYGIIDTEGKIIKDFTLEKSELTSVCNLTSNSYSIKHDLLVAKKDNKYGIIKLTKDEIITDYIYDDVRIYNDKVYKAKINGTWFLYDYNNLEKTHETGYKEIFIVTDNIMVVQKDNYLYIQDYEGHNLTEDKVETYIDYNENACCATPVGTYAEYNKETKKIEITVSTKPDSENNYKTYFYEYDIENKKLTKKDSN